jgi:hypothetical protein
MLVLVSPDLSPDVSELLWAVGVEFTVTAVSLLLALWVTGIMVKSPEETSQAEPSQGASE